VSSASSSHSASLETRVTVPEDVFFRDLGEEAVIMELATGRYFGFDEVGTQMWRQLRDHGQVGVAYRVLLQEFQVSPDELRKDLFEFVDRLADNSLLVLHED